MDYGLFATALSAIGVIASGTVLAVTVRRYLRTGSEWIRRFDGPLTTAIFIIALMTLVPALFANDPNYVVIGRFAISVVRGVVVAVSLILLGHYWSLRESWL